MLPRLRQIRKTNTIALCESSSVMAKKVVNVFLSAAALAPLAPSTMAQPIGDTPLTAQHANEPPASFAPSHRSALWMAVQTLQRDVSAEPALEGRRLTPAERSELRNQVRRAAGTPEPGRGSDEVLTKPEGFAPLR